MNQRSLVIALFAVLGLSLAAKTALHLQQGGSLMATTNLASDTAGSTPAVKGAAGAAGAMHTAGSVDIANATTSARMQPPAVPADFSRYLPQVISMAHAEAGPANASAEHSTGDLLSEDVLINIRKQQQQLNERERRLAMQEEALKKAEERLSGRIEELQQLESSIQQRLNDEKNIKNKKIKRLTAVYEGMKPERAAPVISRLELATVVKVFLLMDEKKVGKILSFLPPEKAVQISQALTRQISSLQ